MIRALAEVNKMKEPYRSILEHDFDSLYQYISTTPHGEWGLSEAGRTPAQMAFHSESGISTAIIIAEYPEALNEIGWSYEQLIEELIGEYSELSLCSGWNDNIEYELWAVLQNEYPNENPIRMGWPSSGVKECILKVANRAKKWVVWGDDHREPTAVDLDQWNTLYASWQKSS